MTYLCDHDREMIQELAQALASYAGAASNDPELSAKLDALRSPAGRTVQGVAMLAQTLAGRHASHAYTDAQVASARRSNRQIEQEYAERREQGRRASSRAEALWRQEQDDRRAAGVAMSESWRMDRDRRREGR